MKKFILLIVISALVGNLWGQMIIQDEHITHQQERMVFKSWDPDKFTPTSGFLGLNPQYWMTWGLHPNYPKTDLRPLSIFGPQSQRLSLALAMRYTDEAYKRHSDTLGNTALVKSSGHNAVLSDLDPLWLLYYKKQFAPLTQDPQVQPLNGINGAARDFLISSGLLSWYQQERESIVERLKLNRSMNMERGSRLIGYHRLLLEHRKLSAIWEQRKAQASSQLERSAAAKRTGPGLSGRSKGRTDVEIADEILKKSRL